MVSRVNGPRAEKSERWHQEVSGVCNHMREQKSLICISKLISLLQLVNISSISHYKVICEFNVAVYETDVLQDTYCLRFKYTTKFSLPKIACPAIVCVASVVLLVHFSYMSVLE